jgi:hypothetical protein
MDNYAWAILIVWMFLTGAGRLWKDTTFKAAGGIMGFVLMAAVYDNSFIFAVALFVINAYALWLAVASEI